MGLSHILLLVACSLDFGNKCDVYVVGNVWIHKTATDDEIESYQGCKKGCYWNQTFTTDGARKCEKCSLIEDQNLCLDNGATCQWKNGKCKSQSCPGIAKTPNSLGTGLNTGGAGRSRRFQECVEGSPQEKYFNDLYIKDYMENFVRGPNTSLNPTSRRCNDRYGGPQSQCRVLPDIQRKICEKNAIDGFYSRGTNTTLWTQCVTEEYTQIVDLGIEEYRRQFYYSTAEAFCDHERKVNVTNCKTTYENAIYTCYTNNGLSVASMQRSHIQTKAARAACHNVYGCIYSESNQRCSYWSVWAFVLTLVICIVVGLAICGVVFFAFKNKISNGGTILHSA